MDDAFVEHPEDEIDSDERSHDQDRRAAERALESLGVALKTRGDRTREFEVGHGLVDGRHRLADRRIRSEIEAQSDRRKLTLVIDSERRDRWADARELTERRHAAARRFRVNAGERVGAE